MKTIVMFQTFDRNIHSSEESALRHLNNTYYKILHKLAGDLILMNLENAMKYIDENLGEFEKAQTIKDDFSLEEDCH